MRARRATCETRIERGVWGAAAPHNANKEKHSTERKRRSHQENNKIDRRARETRIGRGCGGRQPPITPIKRNTAKKGGEENRRGARGERREADESTPRMRRREKKRKKKKERKKFGVEAGEAPGGVCRCERWCDELCVQRTDAKTLTINPAAVQIVRKGEQAHSCWHTIDGRRQGGGAARARATRAKSVL